MRFFVPALALVVVSINQSSAQAPNINARLEHSLKMLEPSERLEQLCGVAAMSAIRKDLKEFRPDRAIANAREEAKLKGDNLQADGAAFRSRKKWYELSFSCTGDAEHMKVLSFSYKVGPEIPESQWAGYNLFD